MYFSDIDSGDEEDWSRQHDWLAAKLNDLHRVFAGRIHMLDADTYQSDRGSEASSLSDDIAYERKAAPGGAADAVRRPGPALQIWHAPFVDDCRPVRILTAPMPGRDTGVAGGMGLDMI